MHRRVTNDMQVLFLVLVVFWSFWNTRLPYFMEIPLCTEKKEEKRFSIIKAPFQNWCRIGKYPKYVQLSYLHSSKMLVQKRALQFIVGLCHLFPAISSCISYFWSLGAWCQIFAVSADKIVEGLEKYEAESRGLWDGRENHIISNLTWHAWFGELRIGFSCIFPSEFQTVTRGLQAWGGNECLNWVQMTI